MWDNEFKLNKIRWKNILFNYKRFTSEIETVNEILLTNFSIKKLCLFQNFQIQKLTLKYKL